MRQHPMRRLPEWNRNMIRTNPPPCRPHLRRCLPHCRQWLPGCAGRPPECRLRLCRPGRLRHRLLLCRYHRRHGRRAPVWKLPSRRSAWWWWWWSVYVWHPLLPKGCRCLIVCTRTKCPAVRVRRQPIPLRRRSGKLPASRYSKTTGRHWRYGRKHK